MPSEIILEMPMVEIDFQAEREKWDQVSAKYIEDIEPIDRALTGEIAAELSPYVPPGGSLLEAGCGSGHLSAVLAEMGYQIQLLDFSMVALRAARRTFKKYGLTAKWHRGNLFEMERLKGQKADCVWNSGVVEHYSAGDAAAALRQMASRSKAYVMTLVPNGQSVIYRTFRQWMRQRGRWEW